MVSDGVRVTTTAYFRGQGPWYRTFDEFPCLSEPVSWFGTPEGVHRAADVGAKAWERLLDTDKAKLVASLRRAKGATPGDAVVKARLAFQSWYQEQDEKWRVQGRTQAKLAEWKLYAEEARKAGVCKARVAKLELKKRRLDRFRGR